MTKLNVELLVDEKIYFLTSKIYPTGAKLADLDNYNDVGYGCKYFFEVAANVIDEMGKRFIFKWNTVGIKGVHFGADGFDFTQKPKEIKSID